MVKNERVAMSNKKPITNVFPNLKNPLSTSEKFQIKKLTLATKERIRNNKTKHFNNVNRFGNVILIVSFLLVSFNLHAILFTTPLTYNQP